MEIIEKIKQVLFNSEKFFLNLNKEKTLQNALKYFLILAAFNAILSFIMLLIFGDKFANLFLNLLNLDVPIPETSNVQVFGQVVLSYVFTIIGSFVGAAILFVWLYIFKGREGYNKAYQLYVYSSTPSLILDWIPFISLISWIYTLILLIIGTKTIYKFSTLKSTLIYVIPLVIFLIIGLIFLAAFVAFLNFRN